MNGLFRVLALATTLISPLSSAETLTIAVASNFAQPLTAIAAAFETDTGHTIRVSKGSTGKHFAQIINGAPFDVFLAADQERPRKLLANKKAIEGTRISYALGRLALWRPGPGPKLTGIDAVRVAEVRHIAMANPRLAPYGAAALSTLKKHGLWPELRSRFVRGENIGQTYQFVKSGNATLGFVALSQLKQPGSSPSGSYWLVPARDHEPIVQDAVLIKESEAGRAFIRYLGGSKARDIIRAFGYDLPQG